MKNRIRDIRKTLNLSQAALAALCNTSAQQISFLEKGERGLDTDWMERIAKALKIEPYMLLIDPTTFITNEDRELLARYHAASEGTKKNIKAILDSEGD